MILNQEQTDFAVSLLADMIDALGLDSEITARNDEDDTVLYLKSSESGRLIGRKGRTLENLEYLLGRALSQKFEGAFFAVLDVDGYQRRRPGARRGKSDQQPSGEGQPARRYEEEQPARRYEEEQPDRDREQVERPRAESDDDTRLRRIAAEAVKEVRRWGEPQTIGPFKAAERKVIHTALAEEAGITAESGEEDRRGMKRITVRATDAQD